MYETVTHGSRLLAILYRITYQQPTRQICHCKDDSHKFADRLMKSHNMLKWNCSADNPKQSGVLGSPALLCVLDGVAALFRWDKLLAAKVKKIIHKYFTPCPLLVLDHQTKLGCCCKSYYPFIRPWELDPLGCSRNRNIPPKLHLVYSCQHTTNFTANVYPTSEVISHWYLAVVIVGLL